MRRGTADHHLAGLDRLAERFQDRPSELGQFIQEQHSAMSQ